MSDDPFHAFVAQTAAFGQTGGPGMRIAVKDMIGVEGMPQPAGIPAREGLLADADAAVVSQFRNAGHTIVGVTVSDAAGFGTMTDTVINPNHPDRAVGGSSGGSAAAVAGGLAEIGLGTDTGGSVRIPAAYCDLYAFKPTPQRVSLDGVLPLSPALDTVGVMAATPSRLAEAARILIAAKRRPGERHPEQRLAVSAEALAVSNDDVGGPFAVLCNLIGAQPIESPIAYDDMAEASSTIIGAEGHQVHAALWTAAPDLFPPLARDALAFASQLTVSQIADARAALVDHGRKWRLALEDVDMLISPTLPMKPAPRGAAHVTVRDEVWSITNANIRLCQFANVAGLPVLVAPIAGQSIQFIGHAGEDEALLVNALAVAERLESALSEG